MSADRPGAADPAFMALVENWWMVGVRGALGVLFGLVLLGRPSVPLDLLVVMFGAYALLDGIWTVASALWVSRRARGAWGAWPVVLEGAVSIAVGALALVWPLIPRQLVWLIALWGVLTGILEILAAVRIPRGRAGYWLLATGGVSSLFLALLILALPHGDRALVVRLLGAYALVFGVVFALAAIGLRRAVATL